MSSPDGERAALADGPDGAGQPDREPGNFFRAALRSGSCAAWTGGGADQASARIRNIATRGGLTRPIGWTFEQSSQAPPREVFSTVPYCEMTPMPIPTEPLGSVPRTRELIQALVAKDCDDPGLSRGTAFEKSRSRVLGID